MQVIMFLLFKVKRKYKHFLLFLYEKDRDNTSIMQGHETVKNSNVPNLRKKVAHIKSAAV